MIPYLIIIWILRFEKEKKGVDLTWSSSPGSRKEREGGGVEGRSVKYGLVAYLCLAGPYKVRFQIHVHRDPGLLI